MKGEESDGKAEGASRVGQKARFESMFGVDAAA